MFLGQMGPWDGVTRPSVTAVWGCWSSPHLHIQPAALVAGAALGRDRQEEVLLSPVPWLLLERLWKDLGQENCSHTI